MIKHPMRTQSDPKKETKTDILYVQSAPVKNITWKNDEWKVYSDGERIKKKDCLI